MSKILIYSTPTCPWCVKAKDFLKEKNVEFTDLDISVDDKAREEVFARSGQMGVPVIVIGKEVIVGFDEEAISKALEEK